MSKGTPCYFWYFIALVLGVILPPPALSQEREKPKLKNFGSSLTRIRWDDSQQAAIEVKSKSTSRANSSETDVVKIETSLVVSSVLVLDSHGTPVSGLTEKDFAISEDGKPQQVGMLSLSDSVNVPRSIVLIVDYGCSQIPFIKASIAAAKSLIDRLPQNDRMAIVTDDIELLSDFTSDKQKLKRKLDELLRRTSLDSHDRNFEMQQVRRYQVPFGRGFQYSALMAVLKEAFSEEDQRPIIIFQTDGGEAVLLRNSIIDFTREPPYPKQLRARREASLKHLENFKKRNPREFGLDDVYKAIEKSRATIYTIVPGIRFIGLKPEERATAMRAYLHREIAGTEHPSVRGVFEDFLNQLSDENLEFEAEVYAKQQSALAVLSTLSGGWIEFFDQPSEADEIYSRTFSDINRRYIVGYYPTNKAHDGKRRKVSIAVRNHPEYIVMGHRGYYAPGPE